MAQKLSMALQDELQLDPKGDRKVSSWAIPRKRLSYDRLYSREDGKRSKKPNPELIKNYQMIEGKL